MTYRMVNLFAQDPPCSDGDTFVDCNLMRLAPNTTICAGVTGLTFRRCNLVNCLVPADATIEQCNTVQVERCAHLHEDWPLPAEADNCAHVTSTDEVRIDGVLVDVTYHYKDTVL